MIMKKHSKIAVLFILTLIVWLLFKFVLEDGKDINRVSMQSTLPVIQKAYTQKNKIITTNKILTEPHEEIEIKENVEIEDLRQMAYLDLYEQSLDLDECLGYIQRIDQSILGVTEKDPEYEKEIDFVEEYKQEIARYSNNRQQQATDKQLSAYDEYIKNCRSIITKIEFLYNEDEAKTNNSYYVRAKIYRLMKETKAKTDEEKELKYTIDKVSELNDTFKELEVLNKGISHLSEEEIRDLEHEIERMKWEVFRLKQSPEGILEPQKLQEMESEFERKKTHYFSLFEYDKQAQEKKGKELLSIIEELNKKLHSKYHRVFIEAFDGLNFKSSEINTLPNRHKLQRFKKIGVIIPIISEQIFEILPIKNKAYYNQLLQPSLDLYLCYLGRDCSLPINRRLANLCYIPPTEYLNFGVIYYEACEMDLEEFYMGHYLTQNQVEDLKVILDYLEQTYAK